MNPTSLPATLFRKREFARLDTGLSLPATLARTRRRERELYRKES